MMHSIGFGLTAACALVSALFVVQSKNLIRAVLWLGVTLLTTAALYILLDASFLAGIQVLLYVGGVITLMIIGVMVTRRHDGISVEVESAKRGRAAVVAVAFFGVLAWAIRGTEGLDVPLRVSPPTIADLGRSLLGEHVLTFEVISVLLLAAIIGAMVIARRRDPGELPQKFGRRKGTAVTAAPAETVPTPTSREAAP